MTHEEMEKAMQFIIEQQAQFAVDLQRLVEQQTQFVAVQAGFQTQLGKLTDATLTLTGLMGNVIKAQAKTEERFARIDERFQALEQKLSQTDDRLNVLIDIVERYITGRDGKPEG